MTDDPRLLSPEELGALERDWRPTRTINPATSAEVTIRRLPG